MNKVVSSANFTSIQNILYLQTKFNLEEVKNDYQSMLDKLDENYSERRIVSSAFEKMSEIFTDEKVNSDDVKILGILNRKRAIRYIPVKYLDKFGNIGGYKVILSAADGASGVISEGKAVRIIGSPEIGEKNQGYTQTFISLGNFSTLQECENLLKYLKTKFARFMVGTKKATNGLKFDTWENVPLQVFEVNVDIDWSKSIAEIDEQLYKKYNLSPEEIAFIEEKIKPME